MGRPITPICSNPHPIVRTIHRMIIEGGHEIGEVSRRSGVGHDTLRQWFNDRIRSPRLMHLDAVLEVLGLQLCLEPSTRADERRRKRMAREWAKHYRARSAP
jgi:transposase-like protein